MRKTQIGILVLLLVLGSTALWARPKHRLRRQLGNQDGRLHTAVRAVQTGHFEQALKVLDGAPSGRFSPQAQSLFLPALRAVIYDAQGSYRQAYPIATRLLQEQQGKDWELQVRLLMVQLARHSGRGDLAEEHLQAIGGLLGRAPRGPATRFFYATLACEKGLPSLDPEALLREHDRVWAELGDNRNFISDAIFPSRWTAEAASIWLLNLERWHFRLDPSHPLAAEVEKRIRSDLTSLLGLGLALGAIQNPELLLQTYLMVIDSGEFALEADRVAKVQELDRNLDQLDRAHGANVSKMAAARVQEFQALGISYDPDAGDLARVRSAHQRLKAHLALKQGQSSTFAHLQSAAQYLGKAPDVRGALHLYALRGTALLQLKPPGWAEQAGAEVRNLSALSQRTGSRVPQIGAQALAALTLAAAGKPAQKELEQAVKEVEALVTETARLRPEEAVRFRRLAHHLYTALVRGYSEQGDAARSLVTLDRQQQLETVVQMSSVPAQQSEAAKKVEEARARLTQAEAEATGTNDQELAASRAAFYQAVRELRVEDQNYAGTLAIDPVEYVEIQRSLPADTLLLQPYAGEQELLLLVVTQSEFKMFRVKSSLKDTAKLIRVVRRELENFGRNPFGDWTQDPRGQKLLESLTTLHQLMIDPLEPMLQGKTRIAYVPYGFFHYLPLQAVYGSQGFLVERFEVVNLTKVTDLNRPARSQTEASILSVGNPDGTLPEAEVEARTVGGLFPKAAVLLGQKATQADFRQSSKSPRRYIHLATHGVLTGEDVLSSYLVLAGEGEDSRLRANEILELDLGNTELVSLSACETGLGENRPGARVTNLAETFTLAGCKSVLATLWSVEDHSTRRLMVDLYQRLARGTAKGAALREAQRTLISSPEHSHPFFWAPFVLVGDWS